MSYLAFLAACVSGLLFLLQEWQLKHKRMGWWFHRLPPLQMLDRINLASIGTGFAFLSVGLIFGFLGSRRLLGHWWSWDPKVLLAVAMWSSYCILWVVRLRATLRGRKVALLSMLGFGMALVTLLGVSRWLPTWHVNL